MGADNAYLLLGIWLLEFNLSGRFCYMEVRCEKCHKLFRVPDEKILEEGIKFACTRCGDFVKITKQEFDQYVLSQNRTSAPDLPEPTPQPTHTATQHNKEEGAALKETVSASAETQNSSLSFILIDPPVAQKKQPARPTVPASPDGPLHMTAPVLTPKFRAELPPVAEIEPKLDLTFEVPPRPIQVPKKDLHIEPTSESRLESAQTPKTEPGTGATRDIRPESDYAPESKPKVAQASEHQLESVLPPPIPTNMVQTKAEPGIVRGPTPKTVQPAAPLETQYEPPARISKPIMERSRPAINHIENTAFSRSVRLLPLLIGAVIIICLAGYVVVNYLKSSSRTVKEAHELSSIEGLLITSVTGTMEANGDILISGAIQNTIETEKNTWFVVAEVYDTQGTVRTKIRLLNGKQLYTRRDYDVLVARGVNVQDLKEKNLQEQGVIIPAKGTVTFEVRYIQPPADIASFKVMLQPYDPIILFREIDEDAK